MCLHGWVLPIHIITNHNAPVSKAQNNGRWMWSCRFQAHCAPYRAANAPTLRVEYPLCELSTQIARYKLLCLILPLLGPHCWTQGGCGPSTFVVCYIGHTSLCDTARAAVCRRWPGVGGAESPGCPGLQCTQTDNGLLGQQPCIHSRQNTALTQQLLKM